MSTATKKAPAKTKKVAVTNVVNAAAPQSATEINAVLKNAYILSAHGWAHKNGLDVGADVYVANYITKNVRGDAIDRNGQALPIGCSLTNSQNSYGAHAKFRGIDADGNAVIRTNGRDVPVPYSFLTIQSTGEKVAATVSLNPSYSGKIMGDGTKIQVGCQSFSLAKVKELVAAADKVVADNAKKPARAALTVNPKATYVPTPKAAKKAPAKKVATKK